jgi:hypothetical protein
VCPVHPLQPSVIEHAITMAKTSETGIKPKLLPFQEMLLKVFLTKKVTEKLYISLSS